MSYCSEVNDPPERDSTLTELSEEFIHTLGIGAVFHHPYLMGALRRLF